MEEILYPTLDIFLLFFDPRYIQFEFSDPCLDRLKVSDTTNAVEFSLVAADLIFDLRDTVLNFVSVCSRLVQLAS